MPWKKRKRARGRIPHRSRGMLPWLALWAALIATPGVLVAQQTGGAAPGPQGMEMPASGQGSPLHEAGNEAFATIQEVVRVLEADSSTDWSKVDLEALRQHLVDMRNFTLNAVVVSKEKIDGGLRVTVRGTTPEATASIQRAIRAHAPALAMETGWKATARVDDNTATLEVTSSDPADVEKIRGLGYIGLMASGAHHQAHHWAIAHGQNPHDPAAMQEMHRRMHQP